MTMSWSRRLVVLLLIASVLGAPQAAAAQATKKGVSAHDFGGVTAALADVRAGWYYTWASNTQGITAPAGVEFVPMIWGPGSVTDAELNQAKALGTTLLGFNEPDMAGQANMTVERALDLWPRLQSLPFVERYAWFTLSTTTSPTGLYTGTTANASGAAYRAAA